jgi:hypothetical protein
MGNLRRARVLAPGLLIALAPLFAIAGCARRAGDAPGALPRASSFCALLGNVAGQHHPALPPHCRCPPPDSCCP